MKRTLTVLLVFTSLLLTSATLKANVADDNFQKAGQDLLAQYQNRLETLHSTTAQTLLSNLQDGKLSVRDAARWRRDTYRYFSVLGEGNNKLSLYGLSLEASNQMYEFNLMTTLLRQKLGDDNDGRVRKYLIQLTGRDIEITKNINDANLISTILLVILAFGIIACVLAALSSLFELRLDLLVVFLCSALILIIVAMWLHGFSVP